jgi:hypothetical protein
MSYELHVKTLSAQRIHVALRGWLEPSDIGKVTEEFLAVCASHQCRQVLYDVRGFVGRPNLDRGYRIAAELPHWARQLSVAFVDDNDWTHYADHMQRVYRDLGFNAVFFSDEAAAMRWLDQQA